MRRFADTLVLLAAAGLIVQTWLVHGWLVPDVVAEASMAPTLRGPHRQVVCPGCGLRYSCDAATDSANFRPLPAICPNCGTKFDGLAELPVQSGDRLLIDRASWNWRQPRRWEMAVLRDPTNPRDLVVKRIVGLPGETVEIREGDVHINGHIACKSLDQLRRTAIPVNRDDCRVQARESATVPLNHWQSGRHAWQETPHGWQISASAPELDDDKPDADQPSRALAYLIRRNYSGGWLAEQPVRDDYAYNIGESRELQPVRDILMRCRVRAAGNGKLYFVIANERASFSITIDATTGACELSSRSPGSFLKEVIGAATIAPERLHSGSLIEFAFFDRQIVFALDGHDVLLSPVSAAGGALVETTEEKPVCHLSIQAGNIDAEVTELEVLRDVYYLPAAGNAPATSTQYQLGPDEYFVLGDNSPVSLDSRVWHADGGVRREHLFGSVLAVLARDKDDR